MLIAEGTVVAVELLTMAQFKFGMFYLKDNTIHVKSTEIVAPQYRQKLVQILKRPDLYSEDGWIQVWWGTRKASTNNVAAKLLLIGGLYCSCMVWNIFWIDIPFLLMTKIIGKLIIHVAMVTAHAVDRSARRAAFFLVFLSLTLLFVSYPTSRIV